MPKKKPDEIAINIADLIPGQTINIPPDTKVTLPPAPIPGLTIGRRVHYVLAHYEHRAADITRVLDKESGIVNLAVTFDGSDDGRSQYACVEWVPNVEYSEFHVIGTWHFMEQA